MGTVIPAGYLVAKQIRKDHDVTPFTSVVHVGDISYAGTGSKDEIPVSLKRMIKFLLYTLFTALGNMGHVGKAGRAHRIDSAVHDKCG